VGACAACAGRRGASAPLSYHGQEAFLQVVDVPVAGHHHRDVGRAVRRAEAQRFRPGRDSGAGEEGERIRGRLRGCQEAHRRGDRGGSGGRQQRSRRGVGRQEHDLSCEQHHKERQCYGQQSEQRRPAGAATSTGCTRTHNQNDDE
jgi:hypothetical protein